MRAAWCRASEDKPVTYMDAELYGIWVKKKQACNLSPLKKDGFEKNGDTVMKNGHALRYAATQTSPTHTRTHTRTARTVAHPSCGQICPLWTGLPQWATSFHSCLNTIYVSSVFPHTPPPPLAPATSNPSTVSHHILVNTIRRKIISNHPDLSLIQVLSWMAGRRGGGWWVANGVKVFGYAGWMHEDNTPAPLPPLSHSVSYIKLIVRLVWLWDM